MERPSLLVVLLFIVCDYYEIFTNKKGLKKIKNVNTIIINGFLLILYFNKKKKNYVTQQTRSRTALTHKGSYSRWIRR